MHILGKKDEDEGEVGILSDRGMIFSWILTSLVYV